ncbi:MAG: 1-acyl-sn-glycerol-3-phosphate acyltransferase [Thermoanaerobaculia bacterium]
MTLIRSAMVFYLVAWLKMLSRIFYRVEFRWLHPIPRDPWADIRLVIFLNHTSLFEPVFLGGVPNRFIWRLAAHGVIPAADKTTERPLVGLIFKFVAHHVVPITRERDNSWFQVLEKIDPKSMVVIAPEGRMKRKNGLDLQGRPMSVRGGVADILDAIKRGKMIIAYSGGMHHVQIPGHLPRLFKTVRMNAQNVEIADYIAEMAGGSPEEFKRNVMRDLDRRRDELCPPEEK